jgi:hypothetical protein
VFHIRKWKEIAMDITLGNPQYYDIRRPQKGVMERKGDSFTKGKKVGTSLHCIMCFQKITKRDSSVQLLPPL